MTPGQYNMQTPGQPLVTDPWKVATLYTV